MTYFVHAAGTLGGHVWWWTCAHFRVCYLIATLLAIPAAFIGQALVPYTGDYIGSIVTVALQWWSFLLAYGFVQRGGLNPLMRRLCPGGTWEGQWFDTTWTQAGVALFRRLRGQKRLAEPLESVPPMAGEGHA